MLYVDTEVGLGKGNGIITQQEISLAPVLYQQCCTVGLCRQSTKQLFD